MKDYKRFTFRSGSGIGLHCDNCKYYKKCSISGFKKCGASSLERLTELEDKIEDGTLVELPCTVGDTIYEVFKNHKPPFIQQTKVEKIIITEKGLKLKLARNSFYETSIASLGKIIFLTEDEARKKLEELEKLKK